MPPTPWAIPAAMVRPTPDQVIVALDGMDLPRALAFSARLRGLRWVKVGPELFASSGEQAVLALGEKGYQVFLDLKFHDIPATMAGACRAAARSGARLLTLHAAAGGQALAAAVEGAAAGAAEAGLPMPTLLAVTVLIVTNPQRRVPAPLVTGPLLGFLTGALVSGLSIGGPIIVLFFLGSGMGRQDLRAAVAFFSTVAYGVALTGYFVEGLFSAERVLLVAASAPMVAVGYWLAVRLTRQMNATRFRQLVVTVIVVTSIMVLARELIAL